MHSLKPYNSFQLNVNALALTEVVSVAHLRKTIKESKLPGYMLGGGSNILLTKDVHAHVLINRISGIKKIKESRDYVFIKVGAGVIWHNLVLWALEQNLGGIENLSLIPGCVGAAPIQNIGAYGVELKDVFVELEAISQRTLKRLIFSKRDCAFGYRDSIFKNDEKNKFYITSVYLKLSKKPKLQLSYGAIQTALDTREVTHPTIKDVSDVVINIRQSKLPDPSEIGNAGSFFKNPVIPIEHLKKIQKNYKRVPSYSLSKKEVKIPAGWLIEQCGWKGRRVGETGCFEKQALVIVNHGNASGSEIQKHALNIKRSVYQKFDILLHNEVNIL